jgi:hypothetical protein
MVAFQDFSTSLGSGEGHSDEVNMKNLVFRSNLPLASASEAGGMKLDLQSLNSTDTRSVWHFLQSKIFWTVKMRNIAE